MNRLALLALCAASLGLTGCATTDATTLPFDLASTTGDAASSSSKTSSGDDSSDSARLEQERYVASQMDWIQRDAARGEGESLQALAELLGEEDTAAFSRWTQSNYQLLFADLGEPQELLSRIHALR